MYDLIKHRIELEISLSETERGFLVASFNPVHIRKNEHLIKTGENVRNLYFINKGYLRAYQLNPDGSEVSSDILTTDNFVTSFEGFINGTGSTENIQCITDCSLLSISKESYDQLYAQITGWPQFCKGIYENHIVKVSRRLLDMQNLSAAERYKHLLDKRPDLAMNIPVKYLASYLGIRPQSLSRIRSLI